MKNNNIIYINDNFYIINLERIREKVTNIAISKFHSPIKAEKWLTSTHPQLGLSPDLLLGTYQGNTSVLEAIRNEHSNWEPTYEE